MKIPKSFTAKTDYAPDLHNIYPKSEVLVRTAQLDPNKPPMFFLDGKVFQHKDDEGRELSNAECYRSLFGFLGHVVPEYAYMSDMAREMAQNQTSASQEPSLKLVTS